jgi:DNA-binding transcriptional MerR regulator
MEKITYNKLFYKIGEVAEMTGLEPYVLRYWESEFGIKLTKSKNSQRLYQPKDIDQIFRIQHLLYEEKFTIAGAKKRLRERRKEEKGNGKEAQKSQLPLALAASDNEGKALKEKLTSVREELVDFLRILDQNP